MLFCASADNNHRPLPDINIAFLKANANTISAFEISRCAYAVFWQIKKPDNLIKLGHTDISE